MNGESSYSRFLSGDNEALGELVEKYNKGLVFYLSGMLKNVALAEDMAADAFVEILVKKPRLKTEQTFCAYLYRSARNNAIDELRRINRRKECYTVTDEDIADTVKLEEAVLKKERDKQLYNAMEQLNGDYKEVLYLIYFQNMTYESAGKIMKKSIKQITNLVYRAKQALKNVLEKEGYNYEI